MEAERVSQQTIIKSREGEKWFSNSIREGRVAGSAAGKQTALLLTPLAALVAIALHAPAAVAAEAAKEETLVVEASGDSADNTRASDYSVPVTVRAPK